MLAASLSLNGAILASEKKNDVSFLLLQQVGKAHRNPAVQHGAELVRTGLGTRKIRKMMPMIYGRWPPEYSGVIA